MLIYLKLRKSTFLATLSQFIKLYVSLRKIALAFFKWTFLHFWTTFGLKRSLEKMISLCKLVPQSPIFDELSSNRNPVENIKYILKIQFFFFNVKMLIPKYRYYICLYMKNTKSSKNKGFNPPFKGINPKKWPKILISRIQNIV